MANSDFTIDKAIKFLNQQGFDVTLTPTQEKRLQNKAKIIDFNEALKKRNREVW